MPDMRSSKCREPHTALLTLRQATRTSRPPRQMRHRRGRTGVPPRAHRTTTTSARAPPAQHMGFVKPLLRNSCTEPRLQSPYLPAADNSARSSIPRDLTTPDTICNARTPGSSRNQAADRITARQTWSQTTDSATLISHTPPHAKDLAQKRQTRYPCQPRLALLTRVHTSYTNLGSQD